MPGSVATVLVVCMASAVSAHFYSTDAHTPPFLRRTDDVRSVVQWDTGDIARQLVLSRGLVVNYQGIYTLTAGLHVRIPPRHEQGRGVSCEQIPRALCVADNASSVVLPSSGDIVVAAQREPDIPAALARVGEHSCRRSGMGYGRIVLDANRYDISACDIYSMHHSFVLVDDVLYVLPITFSSVPHFLMCVAVMFTVSGILYMMRFSSRDMLVSGHIAPNVNRPVHVALLVTEIALVAGVAAQISSTNLVTNEDIIGFAFACAANVFYVASALWSLRRTGVYEQGVTIDALVSGVLVIGIAVYSTLQHPFNFVTDALLIFRMWSKLLRFATGGSYAPAPPWDTPYIFTRFLLDGVNVCFAVAYGWNQGFANAIPAGFGFIPMVLMSYTAAKYLFLLHMHMDTEGPKPS